MHEYLRDLNGRSAWPESTLVRVSLQSIGEPDHAGLFKQDEQDLVFLQGYWGILKDFEQGQCHYRI